MSRSPHARALLVVLVALLLPLGAVASASTPAPLEDFADYEPAARCAPRAKPGAVELAQWLERRFGSHTSISRGCRRGEHVTSEHQEGRAIDWSADARTLSGRRSAQRLLGTLFAPDRSGNRAALARRTGVMYVIWNDHMYAAWDEFRPEPYLSSSCRTRQRCSPTLRHRDHVHVSLTRRAAMARTSWFTARER
jgi:hypothetical protein